MPRDRRPADRQGIGQGMHRLVTLAQQPKDLSSLRVPQRIEGIGGIGNYRVTVTRRLQILKTEAGSPGRVGGRIRAWAPPQPVISPVALTLFSPPSMVRLI
jgi:hypothetical protein